MSELSGKCFCGAVKWRASSKILWAALCHCEDCRRAASSDYVSWFGVEKEACEWEGPCISYRSSKRVTRRFCGECGSPLSFETEVFPNETHLYATTLNDPTIYVPTAHIYWSERLPWVRMADELPKHDKGLQNAAQKGERLL
ncbi:Glutathione-dependent formaldehyde-activating enzyme [Roseovarius albus]|uniref:Glutathione-dependent formaldehyde-activating enzyme n=1 Tax=Roseovarius albus TaxID=1247867 RepID=A0A1X7A1G2_9RHOB|nr:Glutathione-dependent formaldehyde-activating enzyme [Roseovarius albus]